MTLNDLSPDKTYTYADYLTWQFDEMVEIIKGKMFKMSPAPARMHQRVSSNLMHQVQGFFYKKPCQVYHAPFDVRLLAKKGNSDAQILTVVQPDLCVICDLSKLDEKGCVGAPDLVIEILSPSTRKKTFRTNSNFTKKQVCANIGSYISRKPLSKCFIWTNTVFIAYTACLPTTISPTRTFFLN